MTSENDQPNDCTSGWSIAFSGSNRWVPFGPDMNATYWYYAFTRTPRETTGFKLHGQFGHARYQGYNVYDDKTGDFVWADDPIHKSSLRDVDTVPDPGSKNPYLLAVPRDTPERDYTLWVVPEGSDTSSYSNVITFPRDIERPSIYLRVYLPDQNLKNDPNYLSGGVPLPSIEAFDTQTGQPAACPPTRIIMPHGNAPTPMGENTDGQVLFFRFAGGGLYPNQDTAYLASLFKQIDDTVAVIRIKPPTHTDTFHADGVLLAQPMVRYWSFNVYSVKFINVTACLADYQAVVAKDGFVYLVLGRRTPAILEKAKGLNFLPWGLHEEILLGYRNMVPEPYFPYSAAAVPVFNPDEPREAQSAEHFIGDYAPIGVYCSEENFLKDFCGFPVSYP
jgi:hypothetical protein